MSVLEVTVAAATAVLEYDLLTNREEYRQAPYPRLLKGVALKGSAAAGDTAVAIKRGTTEVGRVYNSGTGFPNRDDLKAVNVPVPPNAPLKLEVVDAPATNPINALLEFAP